MGHGSTPGGRAGPVDSVYLGVYRRAAIEQVGGYDEAYQRAEDWEMNHRIRLSGGLVWFQPKLRVTYRPRASVAALGTQYFHYGRWRRVVARQHAGTINLRYLAPPTAVLALAAGTLAGLGGAVFGPGWLMAGFIVPAALPGRRAGGRGAGGPRRTGPRGGPDPAGLADYALFLGSGFPDQPAEPDPGAPGVVRGVRAAGTAPALRLRRLTRRAPSPRART